MSQTYRVRGQVSPEGTLKLEHLPFRAGEEVEVIVLSEERQARTERRYSLRGTALTYDDPTAPVAESDWESSPSDERFAAWKRRGAAEAIPPRLLPICVP